MSVDLPVDQALILKKRARRRLVGAVALVLLMLVILPQVLQDRSAQTKPEPIKITMPETNQEQVVTLNEPQAPIQNEIVEAPATQQAQEPEVFDTPNVESAAALKEAEAKEIARRKALAKAAETATSAAAEPRNEVKASEIKAEAKKDDAVKAVKPAEKAPLTVETKTAENKTPPKSEGSFTVQVGVYSDVTNVKRLQDQLKQAGFTTTTEKTTTPKGEGLRLKAGKFSSRQDAMNALIKIKELGLPGIVISND